MLPQLWYLYPNKPKLAASNGFFRSLTILHRVYAGGMASLLLILLFIVQMNGGSKASDENLSRILQVLAVAASFLSSFLGFRRYKQKLEGLRGSHRPAVEKLTEYRLASVTWWALIEGPGLFAGIAYFLTGNAAFFALAVFHLLFLFLSAPRRDSIIFLLGLTDADLRMLENGEDGK